MRKLLQLREDVRIDEVVTSLEPLLVDRPVERHREHRNSHLGVEHRPHRRSHRCGRAFASPLGETSRYAGVVGIELGEPGHIPFRAIGERRHRRELYFLARLQYFC